ncbi:MAG: hypothetical protein M3Q97_06085, partial [Bacteroidota bacterium]|nr:hypothetical protein [Bacteroidota bacterium]
HYDTVLKNSFIPVYTVDINGQKKEHSVAIPGTIDKSILLYPHKIMASDKYLYILTQHAFLILKKHSDSLKWVSVTDVPTTTTYHNFFVKGDSLVAFSEYYNHNQASGKEQAGVQFYSIKAESFSRFYRLPVDHIKASHFMMDAIEINEKHIVFSDIVTYRIMVYDWKMNLLFSQDMAATALDWKTMPEEAFDEDTILSKSKHVIYALMPFFEKYSFINQTILTNDTLFVFYRPHGFIKGNLLMDSYKISGDSLIRLTSATIMNMDDHNKNKWIDENEGFVNDPGLLFIGDGFMDHLVLSAVPIRLPLKLGPFKRAAFRSLRSGSSVNTYWLRYEYTN